MEHSEFDAAFAKLAEGYREGTYEGRRFSLIVRRSGDGRRNSLFARELDGTDIVSFNLFRVTSDRTLLKPCEMSAEKVVAFRAGVPTGHLTGRRRSRPTGAPATAGYLRLRKPIAAAHCTSSGEEFNIDTSPSAGISVQAPV